jgi:hypothetical protein
MEIGFPRSPERGPIEAADLRSAPAPALRIIYSTLSGSWDRWAQVPWAVGTKGVPLPTATQFRPLRGLELFPRTDSVGGGQKRRALAHGYSIQTTSGFRTVSLPPAPSFTIALQFRPFLHEFPLHCGREMNLERRERWPTSRGRAGLNLRRRSRARFFAALRMTEQVSGVRGRVSGGKGQVSGIRWQVSGGRARFFAALRMTEEVPGVGFQGGKNRCQVSGVRCQGAERDSSLRSE